MSLSINQRLAESIERANDLAETTFCGQEPGFLKLLDELRAIQRHALGVSGCADSPKARGSQAAIETYCVEVGLTKDDGTWFWDKCEGCGWINGKIKIVDWQSTVRAWKRIGVFPSQKTGPNVQNGKHQTEAPIDRMIAHEEFKRVDEKIRTIRETYTGMQTMPQSDRLRLQSLKARRTVLKQRLGIEV